MDAPARLGDGDALNAMRAALVFQLAVRRRPGHEERDFLKTADLRLIAAENLRPPALPLGIARIHAEEACGKECRLLAADASANLDDDVLIVVRVARQKEDRQLFLKARTLLFRRGDLLEQQQLHLGVRLGEHLLVLGNRRLRLAVRFVCGHDGRERGVLARIVLPARHIRHDGGIAEERFELSVFIRDCGEFA